MNIIRLTLKQAYRIIVFIIGTSVLLFGLILIFTPGPAFVFIPAGLLILASEFVWARSLLHRIRNRKKRR
ncbi:MAG: PGPGW domain-containing protein [Nanoarchaeota archaeon]